MRSRRRGSKVAPATAPIPMAASSRPKSAAVPCISPRTISGSSEVPALAQKKNANARSITACKGLALRAKRNPVRMAPTKRSAGSSGSFTSRFHRNNTRITPANEMAFRAKVSHGPTMLTTTPASAGPMARDTLMPTLESATALARSSLPTSSGVSALHAGIISAVPMPSARVSTSSKVTFIIPSNVRAASTTATQDIHSCTSNR
ncbi:hypothetical protein D3C75_753460 [compost metagenome]